MHADQNLVTSIRTAIEDGTADIHYRGVMPTPSMYPSRWTALPMAAAVAAVAALAAVAVTDSGHDGSTAGNRAGVGGGTSGQVVNNDVMLASSLTHAARHGLQGRHATDGKGGAADGCLLPAGDDDACYTQPKAPYPFLMEAATSVPPDATPYPGLKGFQGGVINAWVGEDTRTGHGASVWLKYPDEILEISASYFSTGDQFASYLVQHPSAP